MLILPIQQITVIKYNNCYFWIYNFINIVYNIILTYLRYSYVADLI